MKYIDAEKLAKAIEDKGLNCSFVLKMERLDTLALIDELQQEQPSLPSNLDEAAKEYAKTTFKKPYSDNPDEEVTIVEPDKYAGFVSGAKWQHQKDRAEFAKLKAKEWSDGYDEGIAKGKKQMMSEAVEGTVYGNGVYTWVAGDIPSQFKYGDKVRIIIVKEN